MGNENEQSSETGRFLVDNSLSMTIEYDGVRASDEAHNFFNESDRDSESPAQYSSDQHVSSVDLPHDVRSVDISEYEYVLSDFQGMELDQIQSALEDSTINRTIIILGDINRKENLFIDSLAIDYDPSDFSKRVITLFPGVSNSFGEGNIILKLINEGRQLSSIVKDVKEIGKLQFDIPIDLKGRFEILIEGDEVYYDNQFRFVIEERNNPIISIIDPTNNIYLKEVFGNANLFEVNFLNPMSIDFDVIRKSEVIILNQLQSIPTGLASQIGNKTILIFPSGDSNTSDYTSFGLELENNTSEENMEIDADLKHPLFSGVFDKVNDENTFPSSTIPYIVNGEFETIIPFRNKTPFLIKLNNANHYFFNTELHSDRTNFPSHSIFLPLMYRISLSSLNMDSKSYYYPGDVAQIEVENREIPPTIVSEKVEVIPEFNPSERGINYKIPDLEAGFYSLVHDIDTIEIAINTPKEESVMEGLTREELTDAIGNLKNVRIHTARGGELESAEIGLWKYALILIILIILTETMFHRYLR